jgi:hypothetical protein
MTGYYVLNDGGRAAANYKGQTGDCAVRAMAIALQLDYQSCYEELSIAACSTTIGTRPRPGRTPRRKAPTRELTMRKGIWRQDFAKVLARHGCDWVPTMHIGQGCKVHLCAAELPPGRLIVFVSHHYAAFIDGMLHDTYDSSNDGTRCVYGYWMVR